MHRPTSIDKIVESCRCIGNPCLSPENWAKINPVGKITIIFIPFFRIDNNIPVFTVDGVAVPSPLPNLPLGGFPHFDLELIYANGWIATASEVAIVVNKIQNRISSQTNRIRH